MTNADAWQACTNILCVRLDSLGDVLMTTPAMRALKEGRPDRRITLFTSPSGAEVARLLPMIDNVIVYDAPWMKWTAPRENSQPDYAMIERLRAEQFDGAVIFTVYSQNPMPAAFVCFMADIPLRLAYCHENTYQMLSDWVPDPEPQNGIRHEVQRHLDLVAEIGCHATDNRMLIGVPDGARERVLALLRESGVDPERPWVVVHTGASAASRRYPPEGFAEVARQLAGQHGFQVVFTGSGDEGAPVESIRAMMGLPSYSLVNRLDLGELAALIALAPLLVSNNTGPVHVAASVGTPVIDIYALTNPQHTPWNVPHRVISHDVPCKYCYKSICPEGHNNCLRLITPEEIVAASLDLFQETNNAALQPATKEAAL